MREDEPLEGWLFLAKVRAERELIPYQQRAGGAALGQLAQALAAQPEGKVNYANLSGTLGTYDRVALSEAETAEAQRLFLEAWERGGPGMRYVSDGLLENIALALQPASVPFWRQLLDLSRPRDRTVTSRRTRALAALALLAIVRDDAAAYEAFTEALAHPHEQVRALAAFYLARAYAIPRRTLPEQVEATLLGLATSDRAFAPRFQARAALRSLGRPVPHDDPESAYFLKVLLRGTGVTRTIAVLPHTTLAQLHHAIQAAFDWDADHLYSFYMSADRDDRRYEIRCPELGDDWDFNISSITIVDEGGEETIVLQPPDSGPVADEAPDEEGAGAELCTTTAELGALGLVPKHKFIYFFDYGDSHEFIVTVVGIERRTDDGDYPRVIEARGKAPRQYYSYDDEDDEDET
jgi:hypothetical protein